MQPDPANSRPRDGFRAWLWRNRDSTRLGFGFRASSVLVSAGLALLWQRWLVRIMGNETYGICIAFLSVSQLGGLGDLGVSGAVGIRMLQYLARGEEAAGRRFLANARGVFLGLALLCLVGFLVAAPWIPGWLKVMPTPESGPLRALFIVGGLSAALLILNGYFQNLNAIHGNMVWPVIPSLVLTQLGLLGQWLLARHGQPLWMQYAVILGASILVTVLAAFILRVSHPWLGGLWPVAFDWAEMKSLVSASFWIYLCSLGNVIYVATDQLLVTRGFGADQVPAYSFNYKLCAMTMMILAPATFVAMPGIARRLMSLDPAERANGRNGLERLQQYQAFAACVFAIGYLCVNDWFISLWQGPEYHMSVALQAMFALNLAITIAGDAALQVRSRLDTVGLRLLGLTLGGAGLLNLGLSFVAMKSRWLVGIAAATVVAQSVATLIMNRSTCRLLNLSWPAWLLRSWLAPMAAVGLCALFRHWFPPTSPAGALSLGISCLGLIFALTLVLGLRWQSVVGEGRRLLASFR